MICVPGKDIEIALTQIREMQLQIDGLVSEDRDNKNVIQGLLEDKKRLQRSDSSSCADQTLFCLFQCVH